MTIPPGLFSKSRKGFGAPKADKDVAAAEEVAEALGEDPKELMKKAVAKAKEAGLCTGAACRIEEIKEWAREEGRLAQGSLGAFARAIAHAMAKVTDVYTYHACFIWVYEQACMWGGWGWDGYVDG